MRDGSLAATVLEGHGTAAAPSGLIEACSFPAIGSRLTYLSVRIDPELRRPFRLDGSIITVRGDVAADVASAAVALREAVELAALGHGRLSWPDRILAHATTLVYAGTALRRRLVLAGAKGVGDGASSLLLADLSLDDLDRHPQLAAEVIAAFLVQRDGTDHECPAPELAAAVRALPLARPVQVLLTSGGDDRQEVDWDRGVNTYGVSPRPSPWKASFGSCTASAPTYRGFDAAGQLRHRLVEAALADRLDAAVAAETDLVRETILSALGVSTDQGVEVVLTPSGTDAELVALALSLAAGRPVRSILVGPVEVGKGSVPASAGRHFTTKLPSGGTAEPGTLLEGIAEGQVSVAEIPTRDDAGHLLAPEDVEGRIEAELATTSDHVLLHVVEGSKTGIRLPRSSTVAAWEERDGDRLDVVVDAAQMRIDQSTVGAHLAQGRMIFITGSKFFGGPPFSGALLVPPALVRRATSATALPAGLGAYLHRADVPDALPALRAVASPGTNFGLLTRWEAALAEMRSFHNASPEIRDEVLRVLALGIRRILEETPFVEIVESPYTLMEGDGRRGLDDLPTVFTFLVRNGTGDYLDLEQAKAAHRLLARDVGELLGPDGDRDPHASHSFDLGQPVKLIRRGDSWIPGLRFAVGAPTVSQVVFDHTRGDRWTDRVERELADVRGALAKLALIVERVDLDTVP